MLVTGAGAGIGRELAVMLVGQGARVVALDHDERSVQQLADELSDRVLPVVADVRDRAAMAAAAEQALAWSSRIDIVVANAGVTPTAHRGDPAGRR
ncbi:SDR family NAD(P)-dependent oxidoreductase [Nocardia aurantiaca]|uniref:SDR family NAD(P)-dependent oxidoreductase n=1 Tax=Nocardia aurantiaca TaxID=2675850 RepID=UPI0018A9098B|nr:SDR family NAD(P)-dependent oxidoreductase [Nocardia aurantiaca]